MKLALVVAMVAGMVGCAKLPPIPQHHWSREFTGEALYLEDGRKAASVVRGPDGTQACIFEILAAGCEQFETHQQALDWVQRKYSNRVPDRESRSRVLLVGIRQP